MSEFESLENFEKKTRLLYEIEIGDFKRKILLYINRLEEDLGEKSHLFHLDGLREILICNETVDIESLRARLLEKTKDLRNQISN